MNILFISTQLYPCTIGGVEIFNYHLINSLCKNHNIWILTSCNTNFSQEYINIIKINPRKFGSQKLSMFYEHSRNILKIRNKIDLVHVPYTSRSWLYGCYLPILKKLCDLPYILSLHGGGMYPWKPKLPHKLLFQNADAIVAASTILKKEYEKRSGKKIKVISPIIPFKKSRFSKPILREKYGIEKEVKIILSLGSIKKIKGSDILLDAFLSLGKKYIQKNKINLLYVGYGLMKKELEEKIKKKGFDNYIKFFGSVPYEKVPEMYKIADIYVIPSLYEGLPKSLLEAMFNGLPVIGSNTNGINNIIIDKENGLLFEISNGKKLSLKLKKLIENENLREKIGGNAMKFVKENYNFEDTLSEFIRIYENILNKNQIGY